MSKNAVKSVAQNLGVTSQSIIRKAEELLQLIDIRVGSQSLTVLNLTGSCCVVMCIDLAATGSGQPVNKSEALRLSGVNKKIYRNGLKTLESMLGLEERTTIRDLAIKFGCTGAADLACQVLQSYEKSFSGADMDFSGSLFMASSLCAACRVLKIKVDRTKLIEICSIKSYKVDWEQESCAGEEENTIVDDIERLSQDEVSTPKKQKEEEEQNIKTDYEQWKKQILENARIAIKDGK
ncbi:ORC6 [Mytilus edulis]|uniref:ORC6 n=1 Tax=Mytilus edulis TaxID=6550 RepID=A0A8S3UNL3_MYTED|nr:ORC6 [Mytilus edulis]